MGYSNHMFRKLILACFDLRRGFLWPSADVKFYLDHLVDDSDSHLMVPPNPSFSFYFQVPIC